MLYLYGCPISAQAARELVATLIEDGAPDALAAAGQIGYALDRDRVATGLSPEMRDAVFAVLGDPPSDLRQLRERLGRDCAYRGRDILTMRPSVPLQRPFRLIVIDKDRKRTGLLVDLASAPEVGDHLEIPDGGSVVVHHVSASRRQEHDGVIIAGAD